MTLQLHEGHRFQLLLPEGPNHRFCRPEDGIMGRDIYHQHIYSAILLLHFQSKNVEYKHFNMYFSNNDEFLQYGISALYPT